MNGKTNTAAGLLAALTFLCSVTFGQATGGFHVTNTIRVGGEGGWDYITYDAASHRLFASHGNQVMVVNADSGIVIGSIPNTQGVHGIAIAGDANKGYISDGRSNAVTMFDLQSLRAVKEIPVGQNPDAILYDPFSHRVFVFNGRGQSASVIETATDSVIATIPLGGKPEFAVTDLRGSIYFNVEDKSEIARMDAGKLTIAARWPVAPGSEPSGLAIDREHHRLFSVCANEQMIILDAETGKLVATVPTGKGTDGCAFDPEIGCAFASNGEGTLTVVHEENPSKFTVVENAKSRQGARTITIDPSRHVVFLPTADFGPAPAPTAEHPHPRPSIIPNSFVILRMER